MEHPSAKHVLSYGRANRVSYISLLFLIPCLEPSIIYIVMINTIVIIMYDFKSYNLLFIILSKYNVKCLFKESNSEFGVTEAEEAELIKHIRYHRTLCIP